jgi:hypothetical protein
MTDKLNTLLENIESVKKLDIKDGDVLVFKTKELWRRDIHEAIRQVLKERFREYGFDINVLTLDCGMDIEVLRKADL